MSVPMKWPLVLAVIAGMIFASGGLTLASSGISISAPCSVAAGMTLIGSVTSDSPGIEIEIKDDDGFVIYQTTNVDTDDSPNASGSGYSAAFNVLIPAGTPGPLTITATDAAGQQTTKSVTVR